MITTQWRDLLNVVRPALAATALAGPVLASTALASTALPPVAHAHAQAPPSSYSSTSSDPHGQYSSIGSSAHDASSAAAAASSLSSTVPLSAAPAITLAELAEGPLGSAMFEGMAGVTGSSLSSGSSNAAATFPDPDAPPAEFRHIRHLEGNVYEFTVYSPSMDRLVKNDILLPGGPDNTAARPTFYLMMGADGAAGGYSWYNSSNYQEFFADKHVNVVTPKGSVSSMQADWYEEDVATGTNKWSTYLTRELPPLVDELFHGTGRDAIAGISMSGGPALAIASLDSQRFKAAGSYSGCPSTTGVLGLSYAWSGVTMNGADPTKMWGLPGDEAWAAHSPVLHIEALRDTAVFVGSAQGVPGEIDAAPLSSRINAQMGIEMASYACSAHFVDQARKQGLEVTWYPLVEGTHTWGVFEKLMRKSWPTIGPAIGVE
ncbi:alpha/beta hydrolase [Corynebacterium cystitidis]|uniref:alpha/beta hydrolase n=1 Tax=Corynebacterium cystitidis TaxID=35757 RepID=UPI00211F24D9|nr:alpha/beta hydrolase family protein [Corynebacterium cystitidis]